MLVHICCSVDSHYFLSELQKIYPKEKIIGFFYNPNIHPKAEHDLRLADVQRSCKMLGIELLHGDYDVDFWLHGVRGLEEEPEKGERCVKCFDIRLVRSAMKAKQIKEKRFTTTLLSSPMKEQERLFTEGDKIAKAYELEFIKINVRSNGGVQKQNLLAKKDYLYRQNYCGCKFALSKQREKQGKVSLELLSDIFDSKSLGSIQERQEVFAHRDKIEKEQQPYFLVQRKYQVHRVLNSRLLDSAKNPIAHYVVADSQSKKKQISQIDWVKPCLNLEENTLKQYLQDNFSIGFSSQDDSIFVLLDFINLVFKTNFTTIKTLKSSQWDLQKQMDLRKLLCGSHSINAIIIVEKKIQENITLELQCLFQEENIFRVVEFL